MEFDQAFAALHRRTLLADRETKCLQCIEHAGVRLGLAMPANDFAQAISKKRERALGGHLRVKLTHGTGSGIARIDEGLVPTLALTGIELLEIVTAHIDLAAHFQHLGHRPGHRRKPQRNLADRADVLRDVFACGAIAACGCLYEKAALVAQVDRQTIELQFGGVFDGRIGLIEAQLAAHAGIERAGTVFGGVGLGADRQHRNNMPDLRELRQDPSAHTERGRVRCLQFGMFSFQCFQLAVQPVVFGVRHAGLVEHVVLVGVVVERGAQPRCPRLGRCSGRGFCGLAHGNWGTRQWLNKRTAALEPAGTPRDSSLSYSTRRCFWMATKDCSVNGRRLSSTTCAPIRCDSV